MAVLQVRPLPNEKGWFIADPALSFETFIGGEGTAPSPASMQLMECALADIDALVAKAKAHLDAFVDRHRFAPGHEWFFEGISVGRDAVGAAPTDFWLAFSIEEDIYGAWETRLKMVHGSVYVVEVRRVQS